MGEGENNDDQSNLQDMLFGDEIKNLTINIGDLR